MVPLIIGVLARGRRDHRDVRRRGRRGGGEPALDVGARAPRRCTGRRTRVPELRRGALRFAGWTTVSALVTLVVWRRSEFLFLAHYSTDAQIGLYSIAFATVTAISAIPEQLSTVLVSAFATLRGADAAERISPASPAPCA